MKLTHRDNRYVCICRFEEKDIPKGAGFRWSKPDRYWWTDNYMAAEKLIEHADEMALAAIEKAKQSIVMSSASSADIDIPCPEGLSYMPFQKAGIQYALQRNNTLIGDEMGLGKTIQAIGYINATKPESVIIVCPALLKLNWKNELEKWLVDPYRIDVLYSSNGKVRTDTYSMGDKGSITIVNYDIISSSISLLTALICKRYDLLIADECHYVKNPGAKRTHALKTLSKACTRKLFSRGRQF